MIQSPLNYTGGKFKLLAQIFPLFPTNIDTFVDLFCGGCNVGINVKAAKHIYNDINFYLPRIYHELKTHDKDVTLETMYSTINIWKAVSSVPLQSSTDKSKYTDNVIIMLINNNELEKLMDRKHEYNEIIQQVRALFLKDVSSFDKDWRQRFIEHIMS